MRESRCTCGRPCATSRTFNPQRRDDAWLALAARSVEPLVSAA